MSLEVTGRIHLIGQLQQIKDNFCKQEVVLELTEETPTGTVYTNYATFQFMNKACDALDQYSCGDMVKLSFNLRGTEWTKDGVTKYITNLNAWRIERAGQQPTQQQQVAQYTPPQQGYTSPQNNVSSVAGLNNPNEASDDLPF